MEKDLKELLTWLAGRGEPVALKAMLVIMQRAADGEQVEGGILTLILLAYQAGKAQVEEWV